MLKNRTLFTLGLLTFVLSLYIAYSIYQKQTKENSPVHSEELRLVILNSLSNPFPKADTVVIETNWGFCGNSPSRPVIFYTRLDAPSNINKLSEKFGQRVVNADSFQKNIEKKIRLKYNTPHDTTIYDKLTNSVVEFYYSCGTN